MGRPIIEYTTAEPLIARLRDCADIIIAIDGDRDHMNKSDLTVEQTMWMCDLIRSAIAKLINPGL